MSPRQRLLVIALVAAHLLALAVYTLPAEWSPGAVRVAAERYARPLFHQQWRLFAPDPPLCSAEVCWMQGEVPTPLHAGDAGYLTRRMAQTVARHVQAEVALGDTVPRAELVRVMNALTRDVGRDIRPLNYVLMERCVVDPENPAKRVERITPLHTKPR